MIKALVIGLALALGLIAAGSGSTSPAAQAARAIPWDCSDWQAFAHDNRTTSILESLAANRGKTLYCGIDQSDTFAKAETWEAGKDRNERDDTVYQGEQGRFRGFIAAQEGWLTEGESGITGMSIDRIFEFPREEKKRRRNREKRLPLRYGREYPNSELEANSGFVNAGGETGGYLVFDAGGPPYYVPGPRMGPNAYVRSALGAQTTSSVDRPTAEATASAAYTLPTQAQMNEWALNGAAQDPVSNTLELDGGATQECVALGWRRATNVRAWVYLENGEPYFQYVADQTGVPSGSYGTRAHVTIHYEATCKK